MSDGRDDLSRTQRALVKAGLLVEDTQEVRQRSLSTQLSVIVDNLGRTTRLYAALGINIATILAGAWLYTSFSGLISYTGAILSILAALAIVRWVVGL